MKSWLILFTAGVISSTSIAKTSIAFIGLSGNNAPSLEAGYDKLFREKLSMDSEIYAVDYLESQRYRRFIKFDNFPSVSQKNAESLSKLTNDSTLLIWGTVKKYQLSTERKNLVFSRIKGELVIGLHIFSIPDKSFFFIGNVNAIVYNKKKFSLSGPPDPVTATDQAEMIQKLQSEAVSLSSRIVSAVIRGKKEYNDREDFSDNQVREPSISDVFSIPSIEPAQIDPAASMNDSIKDVK